MVNKDYPAWVEASKLAMDVMKKYMDKDKGTQLNYASQYASVANYWKNRQVLLMPLLKTEPSQTSKKSKKDLKPGLYSLKTWLSTKRF
jgi:hypothetical protein